MSISIRRFRRALRVGSAAIVLLILGSVVHETRGEDHAAANEGSQSDGGPVRMITVEELSRNDGNQTEFLWLSIMGKVYDVTAGKQFYGPKGPYEVFVGRDANVPFITGNFTEEEAKRSLLSLTSAELYNLETWTDFYDKEAKYKFVGLLIGELYDEHGKPTETHGKVVERIAEGRREAEERKRKRQELIAKRKKEALEKKKAALEKKKLDENEAAAEKTTPEPDL